MDPLLDVRQVCAYRPVFDGERSDDDHCGVAGRRCLVPQPVVLSFVLNEILFVIEFEPGQERFPDAGERLWTVLLLFA
ncbi:hypothetical protein [Streptomyces sp. NPDC093544]|uniref:hypothetical protein n=1 Tax=Streptomyces sp. NPDC093544 TaxID=3155200 RepID=UPI003446059B